MDLRIIGHGPLAGALSYYWGTEEPVDVMQKALRRKRAYVKVVTVEEADGRTRDAERDLMLLNMVSLLSENGYLVRSIYSGAVRPAWVGGTHRVAVVESGDERDWLPQSVSEIVFPLEKWKGERLNLVCGDGSAPVLTVQAASVGERLTEFLMGQGQTWRVWVRESEILEVFE